MTSFINKGKSLLKGTSKEFSGDHLLKNLCENTHQDLTYQNKLQEINLVLVRNFHPSIFDKRYINSLAQAVFDILVREIVQCILTNISGIHSITKHHFYSCQMNMLYPFLTNFQQ